MNLRARLGRKPILTAPGCYDALTALLVERAGFEAAYVSGASVAYTRLGRPDVGLVSVTELAETVALMRERVTLPLIVDIDTGFGNAVNVQRTVRTLARAGANAVQIEDQDFPKRCGHLAGKALVPTEEMVGKVKAALDARPNADCLIVARTDAISVEGFERALDRADAYLEAGADVLFVEAPQTLDQFRTVGNRFGARVPLLANMVEGGQSPLSSAHELEALGFGVVIFPGAMVRIVARAGELLLDIIRRNGATASLKDQMHDLKSLNELLGTTTLLDAVRAYDPQIGAAFGKSTS